jgi:hypothetical protein
MSGIFICYRREDSSPHAGRLYDRFLEIFGTERVFMDVDGIQPGQDFVEAIEEKVRSCNAMVVVIGREWLKAVGQSNRSRLEDPQDYVRLEILSALQRKIRIIPVLVSGARMPRPEDLPTDIAQLARRQAVELNDALFRQSLAPLIGALQNALPGSFRPAETPLVGDPRIVERPVNLSFDGAVEGAFPHGWFNSCDFVSGVSSGYTVRVIQRDGGVGRCLLLQKQSAETGEFGSVMQRFPAGFLAGRTVKLEGDIRTERVSGWAGFWLRADGTETPDLFFDNMNGQDLSGTTAWKRYSIEGRLPLLTAWLNFGVVLSGSGHVWVDDLRLLRWNTGAWVDV